MRLILSVILVIFAISPANAGEAWKGFSNITVIYPEYIGLIIYLDGNVVNPDGLCEPNRMRLLHDHPNYDTMAAALLAAFSQNRQVNINYDTDTLSECNININRFQVKK